MSGYAEGLNKGGTSELIHVETGANDALFNSDVIRIAQNVCKRLRVHIITDTVLVGTEQIDVSIEMGFGGTYNVFENGFSPMGSIVMVSGQIIRTFVSADAIRPLPPWLRCATLLSGGHTGTNFKLFVTSEGD